jgi:hypothetical protein
MGRFNQSGGRCPNARRLAPSAPDLFCRKAMGDARFAGGVDA